MNFITHSENTRGKLFQFRFSPVPVSGDRPKDPRALSWWTRHSWLISVSGVNCVQCLANTTAKNVFVSQEVKLVSGLLQNESWWTRHSWLISVSGVNCVRCLANTTAKHVFVSQEVKLVSGLLQNEVAKSHQVLPLCALAWPDRDHWMTLCDLDPDSGVLFWLKMTFFKTGGVSPLPFWIQLNGKQEDETKRSACFKKRLKWSSNFQNSRMAGSRRKVVLIESNFSQWIFLRFNLAPVSRNQPRLIQYQIDFKLQLSESIFKAYSFLKMTNHCVIEFHTTGRNFTGTSFMNILVCSALGYSLSGPHHSQVIWKIIKICLI